MNTNLSSSKEDEESLLKHSAHGRSQISVPAVRDGVGRGVLSGYRVLNENIVML